ncbi:uncharacterized protein METZ01_LOCUS175217 [marine metagenome]|uniref:HMA domain-containing protein n=1 Tax=marine metagenome TaxID=408172 RepID=A0A382CAT5_9ZZZZ
MNKKSTQLKSFKVSGMSCGHCTAQVQAALENLEDVLQADVSLSEQTASIHVTKDIPNDVLTEAVEAAGYKAVPQ